MSFVLRSLRSRSFTRACVAAFALAVGWAQAGTPEAHAPVKLMQLTERFATAGQIRPEQLAELKALGYTTIVALRPDGEAADQPSAAQIEAAARSNGMSFAYVPVAPGGIPDSQVTALALAIASDSGKVLAYCRSGSRAARTWSLAEASRPGGAGVDTILGVVKAGGHSADDLRTAIEVRVSERPSKR
jgi:uncharacterized protein (TIGR01244 family)